MIQRKSQQPMIVCELHELPKTNKKYKRMKSIIFTATTILTASQFIRCDVENKEDIKGRLNILFAISEDQINNQVLTEELNLNILLK